MTDKSDQEVFTELFGSMSEQVQQSAHAESLVWECVPQFAAAQVQLATRAVEEQMAQLTVIDKRIADFDHVRKAKTVASMAEVSTRYWTLREEMAHKRAMPRPRPQFM